MHSSSVWVFRFTNSLLTQLHLLSDKLLYNETYILTHFFNIYATISVWEVKCRAGTAGTAIAVPVFEEEKWRRFDSNLTCVIECPLRALRRSLGRLRGLEVFKHSK